MGFGFCVGHPFKEVWTAGRARQFVSDFAPAFKTELEKAGYKVVTPGEDNLFDPEAASAADYEAAAVIKSMNIDGCIGTLPPFEFGKSGQGRRLHDHRLANLFAPSKASGRACQYCWQSSFGE